MSLLRSLNHRPFALLWFAQTISRVGDHLYQIALAWWVLQKTGSATAMGTVMICAFAPMLVFLLIGGVAVDRLHRVGVMLISDVLRGVLVGMVAVLAFSGRLEVWHVYLASLLFGFVDAFFNPAYAAAVPEMVPAEHLPSANSLTSLSQQFGRIAGPPLGAAITGVAGIGWAFALNALSFFISAAFLIPLFRHKPRAQDPQTAISPQLHVPTIVTDPSDPPEPPARPNNVFRDLRDGIRFVLAAPWLWITIVMFTLANVLLAGPYSVSLPLLVKQDLHRGVKTLGFLYAMFPAGYAIAAILLGRLPALRRRGWIIYSGIAAAGLMMLILGLPVRIVVLGVAAAANGFALEAASLAWTTVLQQRVPGEMLGRVSSIDSLGSFALLPIGYALAGWATDRFGAPHVFLVGGGLAALVAVCGLVHPTVRQLD